MAPIVELEHLPIRVDAQGNWLHGNEPLHPRVARLFAANVDYDGDRPIIRLGFRTHPLQVADTPYFVRQLHLDADDQGIAAAAVTVSDGTHEDLSHLPLLQGDDNVFYAQLTRRGRPVRCRFSAEQYHRLGLYADVDEDGIFLRIAGSSRRIQQVVSRPSKTD